MENNDSENGSGGGTIREFGFAIITFLIMVLSIYCADRLEQGKIISGDMRFIFIEFATYLSRISLVLFTVWLYKGIGFPRTIGPDFKNRFNRGWREMSDQDATKWMIIVFLGLFLGGTLLMLA